MAIEEIGHATILAEKNLGETLGTRPWTVLKNELSLQLTAVMTTSDQLRDLGREDQIAERHSPAGPTGGPDEEVDSWC
ncbi:hypothetical protein AB0M36_32620 [Actinoplanes sp. NPDC051346]|uniref:hypothetical protein n=1 Tax=Actinoplanes sp. NPDC051346 TaxID=3155048 RepID=UPI003436B73A